MLFAVEKFPVSYNYVLCLPWTPASFPLLSITFVRVFHEIETELVSLKVLPSNCRQGWHQMSGSHLRNGTCNPTWVDQLNVPQCNSHSYRMLANVRFIAHGLVHTCVICDINEGVDSVNRFRNFFRYKLGEMLIVSY